MAMTVQHVMLKVYVQSLLNHVTKDTVLKAHILMVGLVTHVITV